MKVLVVIPTTKPDYSFGISAPLGWLFTGYEGRVQGIYGFQLYGNTKSIRKADYIIIQLNWFTELCEAMEIADHIKSIDNNKIVILGGLFSCMQKEELRPYINFDYLFYGDSEKPMKMFLDGMNIKDIPNIYNAKDNIINERWHFSQNDYDNIDFSIEWFPEYKRLYDQDSLRNFEEETPLTDICMFPVPMILTSKNCTVSHPGCEYCLGSKEEYLRHIYDRPIVEMTNSQLMDLIKKASKYKRISLEFLNNFNQYDFTNMYFDVRCTAQIDCVLKDLDKIRDLKKAFKEITVILPLNKNGMMSTTIDQEKIDLVGENTEHRNVILNAYEFQKGIVKQIQRKTSYPLGRWISFTLNDWTGEENGIHFDQYKNIRQAYYYSKSFYKNNKIAFRRS